MLGWWSTTIRMRGGKSRKSNLEVDFVVMEGSRKYYIQSALTIEEEEKRLQEIRPLVRIPDSFKKICCHQGAHHSVA